MERQWYLSRGGQVFGPVTDTQLRQSAAAGMVAPTDMLNPVGDPNWWAASAIPGLLPVAAALPVAAPAPKPEPRTVRVTCFACFNEVALMFQPGVTEAPCPKCRAMLATGEAESVSAPDGSFPTLESPAEMKARLNAKVAAAHAAEGGNAVTRGLITGVIRGLTQ